MANKGTVNVPTSGDLMRSWSISVWYMDKLKRNVRCRFIHSLLEAGLDGTTVQLYYDSIPVQFDLTEIS